MGRETRPVTLSVAGSDSGGGAGIQADLRTFSQLGTFGTTVTTALTAQNLQGVHDVHGVPRAHIESQIDAVLRGFDVAAAKTGMLWTASTVYAVADIVRARKDCAWVVDPVMVSASGHRLLQPEAVVAYQHELLPAATLATPNVDEAAMLLGDALPAREAAVDAALRLADSLGCSVLLTGGHLQGDPMDTLAWQGQAWVWTHTRVAGVNTHGSGCILAAAIAAFVARGLDVPDACGHALGFTQSVLHHPHQVGAHQLAGIEHVALEQVQPLTPTPA